MKMRIFSLTALVLLMLSITAQAIEPRATGGNPVLTFDGTTAQCSVTCTGNKSTIVEELRSNWDGLIKRTEHTNCYGYEPAVQSYSVDSNV